jgi:hypothetical protein
MKIKSAILPFTVLAAVLSAGNAHAALLVPPSGSDTILSTGADDTTFGPQNIGFTFQYYGISTSTVTVDSNGNLNFDGSGSNLSGSSLPTTVPRIAPLWDDVVFSGGQLRDNSSVGGQYTVIWNGAGFFFGGNSATFEAILLGPGNALALPANSILFSYDTITGLDTANNSASVGLDAGDGVNFESLFPLGVGAPDGIIDGATAASLSGRSFLFTPVYGFPPPQLTEGGGLNQIAEIIVDYNVSEYNVQSDVPEGVPSAWAMGLMVVACGGYRYLRSRKA